MTGLRSDSLDAARRSELSESFGKTLADESLTAGEAERLGVPLGSYKSLRGRWEARGREWPAARADVVKQVARAEGEEDERRGFRKPRTKAAQKTEPADDGVSLELVEPIVFLGEMTVALLTAALGKWWYKLPAEAVAPYTRADVDGHEAMKRAAVPLARYVDARFGKSSEHAPLIVFGLVIAGGTWKRAQALAEVRASMTAETEPSPAPSVPPPNPGAPGMSA